MKQYNNTQLFGYAVMALVMIPVSVLVNGMLVAFAWNDLIVPIFGFITLNYLQGMGISIFIAIFLVGIEKAENSDNNPSISKLLTRTIAQWILLFAIVWLVSLTY